MEPVIKSATAIFLLVVCASCTQAQRTSQNEPSSNSEPTGIFYFNALTVNAASSASTLKTKRERTLVSCNLAIKAPVESPFFLHLRRAGKIIAVRCCKEKTFLEAEISILLDAAEEGDELIVEPVNKEDWMQKRILTKGAKNGC